MKNGCFSWLGQDIPFREGESIAAALGAQGIDGFGPDASGRATRYFCGIGACQCCLVSIDGKIREACLTPARAGLDIRSAGARPDGDCNV